MKLTRIGEIPQGTLRVTVIGVAIHVMENFILIEDGTGKAKIYNEEASKYGLKSILLVMGNVLSTSGELKEIEGEILVDLSGIDLRLLRKSLELEKELEELESRWK